MRMIINENNYYEKIPF